MNAPATLFAYKAFLTQSGIRIRAFRVVDAPDYQRAPYGWSICAEGASLDEPHIILLSGEDVVLHPLPHQPEWGRTAEEATTKLVKQLRNRQQLAFTQAVANNQLVIDYQHHLIDETAKLRENEFVSHVLALPWPKEVKIWACGGYGLSRGFVIEVGAMRLAYRGEGNWRLRNGDKGLEIPPKEALNAELLLGLLQELERARYTGI